MSDKPKRLSDQELKDQLLEKSGQKEKVETIKELDFPTEIIDLPSKGIPYPEDSPLSSGGKSCGCSSVFGFIINLAADFPFISKSPFSFISIDFTTTD